MDLPEDWSKTNKMVPRHMGHKKTKGTGTIFIKTPFFHPQSLTSLPILHVHAIFRILRYISWDLFRLGLFFSAGIQSGPFCFTHADYARSKTDRWSISGFCTFYGNYIISWWSKKQAVVYRSSAEAEYQAVAQGTCEILSLQRILDEFVLWKTNNLNFVTINLPLCLLQIQFFLSGPNITKWTSTLSERKFGQAL